MRIDFIHQGIVGISIPPSRHPNCIVYNFGLLKRWPVRLVGQIAGVRRSQPSRQAASAGLSTAVLLKCGLPADGILRKVGRDAQASSMRGVLSDWWKNAGCQRYSTPVRQASRLSFPEIIQHERRRQPQAASSAFHRSQFPPVSRMCVHPTSEQVGKDGAGYPSIARTLSWNASVPRWGG